MTVTITHVYDDYSLADTVVSNLEQSGVSHSDISIIGRRGEHGGAEDTRGDGAAAGATLGGVAGAGAGLLAALGLIAIPGIGPLVAAGVIATTLAGAATGAVAGGLVGALVEYGVSEEEAPVYAESVRRGGTLVSVRADESRADEVERIMQDANPIDMTERGRAYREQGWNSYDPSAPAYTDEQMRAERDRYNTIR